MGWKNAEKTTVGRDWGDRPSLVEAYRPPSPCRVGAARLRAWPLDERGQRRDELKSRPEGTPRLEIGPSLKTIWYEIEIR